MNYRQADQESEERIADEARRAASTNRLAEEGRRKRAALTAAREAGAARANDPRVKAALAAAAAEKRLCGRVEAGATTPSWPPLVCAIAGVVLLVECVWGNPTQQVVLVSVLVALMVAMVVAYGYFLNQVVPRARAHVAALPFEVMGFFETLGTKTEIKTIATRLVFEDPAHTPDPQLVADLVGRIASDVVVCEGGNTSTTTGARTFVERIGTTIRIRREMTRAYGTFEYSDETQWSVLQNDLSEIYPWMQAVADEVLVPLHHKTPLARVEFAT